jgi:L-lactate utilization protein LutB
MDTAAKKQLEANFTSRNIAVAWFGTFDEAKRYLLQQIPPGATVGIGNSQTLKNMEMTRALCEKSHTVYDKTFGKTPEEVKTLKRQALLTDVYISGANAVSADGQIVNIDHSGNRVAALAYGPERVFIVVGKNKVTPTYEEALYRARNTAAPLNARRAGYQPPCTVVGRCTDCHSTERVCFNLSVIEGQHEKHRMMLLIVDEEEGF